MKYSTITINGLKMFYRESGNTSKPAFLLLHGFPTASHMFRNLMPLLEKDFHVIAPDFIGFGQSEAPLHKDFDYTFENLTNHVETFTEKLELDKFYMYVFDYQNNVKNYPRFQKYVRDNQPEILAAWGKNDPSFVYPGAEAFEKDDKNTEVHLLDGGHFVLESHWQEIGQLILNKWA